MMILVLRKCLHDAICLETVILRLMTLENFRIKQQLDAWIKILVVCFPTV